MGTSIRSKALGALIIAGALAFAGTPAFAASGTGYTCTGGEIPSGDYTSVSVTGACAVAEDAIITVSGNINVAAGAVLDAQTSPSTIRVARNVTAGPGSLLGLGCQPPAVTHNSGHPCTDAEGNPILDPSVHSDIDIAGNVTATGATAVLLNGVSVGGNVTVTGGGSPFIPWSIKNNTVAGNLTMSGQNTDWIGVLFNRVGGNATISNIVITDTDPGGNGMYVAANHIGRNLTCTAVSPKVSGSFIPGNVNIVGGKALGQCAGI